MQFIEALKLKSKLSFLFTLITLGLITVGIMGALNVESMKKNLDSLYFGSLVPITELNEILQTYHTGLASTIYKAKNAEQSSSVTLIRLEHSINKINKTWKAYESHFKRDNELEYEKLFFQVHPKQLNSYFFHSLQSTSFYKNIYLLH